MRKCSWRRWEVYGLPCKHVSTIVMQMYNSKSTMNTSLSSCIVVHMRNPYTRSYTIISQTITTVISACNHQSQRINPDAFDEKGSNHKLSMFLSHTIIDVMKLTTTVIPVMQLQLTESYLHDINCSCVLFVFSMYDICIMFKLWVSVCHQLTQV